MTDDPYLGSTPTRPKQTAQAPEPRLREDEPTMQRCPLCMGGCMVTPEVAAMFERMLRVYREQR